MSRTRDIALLQLHLTSGIDVMAQMPVVSELLKRLVPSFSLSMIRVDERCAPREHYSEYFDEFSHQLFTSAGDQFALRTTDPAAFGNLLRNRRPVGTLVDTKPEYLAGATYQHLFKRNGIHHTLDVAMRDGTGPIGILGVFREERAPHFGRSEVALANQLYEHLVHACAQRGGGTLFDEIGTGLVVVDLQGKIQWASSEARRWLEAAAVGDDRAPLVDRALLPQACRDLGRIFVRSRSTFSRVIDRDRVPTMTLPVPGGRLRLRAYGLESTGEGESAYVGIQIGLEMDRTLRVLRALDRTSLTPQQCRIALAHWRRQSTSEIRALAGVSASTLKSYHKDLYGRLGVTSSTELVSLLDTQASAVTFDLRRHRPRAS